LSSRTILNIVLAAAIAAIAAALYFKPKSETADTLTSYPLIAEDLQNVHRIEIQRLREQAVVLERNGAQWRMRTPLAALFDEVQVSRVLDVARLRATARLRAEDLGRFELEQPWARVKFNEHLVEFGATNQLTQELYLRSGEYVYAVPPQMAAAIPGNVARWLAHRLLDPDERPVAFELARFSLRHDGTRWLLAPNDPGLSQDDLVRWVEHWRSASSVVTQPATLSASSESITIELRDARKIEFAVVARTPDLVLLRQDEKLQYHLPASLGELLLASPSAAAAPTR
jgi:hypothetical protein